MKSTSHRQPETIPAASSGARGLSQQHSYSPHAHPDPTGLLTMANLSRTALNAATATMPATPTQRPSRTLFSGLKSGFRPFLDDSAASFDPLLALRRSHGEDVTLWQDKIEEFRNETQSDAQAIVEDADEFSHFQEHLRAKLYMTNFSLQHNLHKLLKIHRNEMEWRKRPNRSLFSSLPKNSIYESEFSCESDTSTATETASTTAYESKPPSPKSVISIVSRDDAIMFSKPPADIVHAFVLDDEAEETKDSYEIL